GRDRRRRASSSPRLLRRLGAGEPQRGARARGRGRKARPGGGDRARRGARRRRRGPSRGRRDAGVRLDGPGDPGPRDRARGHGAPRRALLARARALARVRLARSSEGGVMDAKLFNFEIPAQDGERSMNFWKSLFGWKFQAWEGPVEYHMLDGNEPGGALYPDPGGARSGPVVRVGRAAIAA